MDVPYLAIVSAMVWDESLVGRHPRQVLLSLWGRCLVAGAHGP